MSSNGETSTVVIGVGNVFRRDDGAGDAVAERVEASLPDHLRTAVRVVVVPGEPTSIIDLWDDVDLAVIVDAVSSSSAPGVVHHVEMSPVLDPAALGLLQARRTSSHGTGIAEAVALGEALGRLPRRLVVYGIEGADFGDGRGLSPAVESAVEGLTKRVLDEVRA